MTTIGITRDLAAFLVPLGVTGAVLAVICAIVAGVAIARGAGGLSGGAVGVWIPFAMLSFTASFATQWMPAIVSGVALAAMLVLGGIARAVLRVTGDARLARRASAEAQAAASAPATTTIIVPARASAPTTGSIAIVR